MNKVFAGIVIASACSFAHAGQDAGTPKLNYRLHCAGCHVIDGSGLPRVGIPSFRHRLGYFLNTEGGREFLIQVPGASHSPLSNAELAELMNWMLKAFSADEIPGGARAFTAEEVTVLRRNRLVDVPGRRDEVTSEIYRDYGVDIRDYK